MVPSEKALPVSAEGILEQEDRVRYSFNANITVVCVNQTIVSGGIKQLLTLPFHYL